MPDVEPTPYEARYFKSGEHAWLILALSDPGTGFIDNRKGGMPGQP